MFASLSCRTTFSPTGTVVVFRLLGLDRFLEAFEASSPLPLLTLRRRCQQGGLAEHGWFGAVLGAQGGAWKSPRYKDQVVGRLLGSCVHLIT